MTKSKKVIYLFLHFFLSTLLFAFVQSYAQVNVTPEWYDANRVQAHTRLGPVHPRYGAEQSWLDTPESNNAGLWFQTLGTQVYTRHVKARDEDPWWPSLIPLDGENRQFFLEDRVNQDIFVAAGRNIVQEMITDAHQHQEKMIAYYWHMTDARMAQLHPEWICHNPKQELLEHTARGTYLDITGPYREIILGRLLELAEMGADGFFFDERHLPREGCWDTTFQEEFETTHEREAPKSLKDALDDLEWQQFRAEKVAITFKYWSDTIKANYPHMVLIVSTFPLDALTDPEVSTKLASFVTPKSEFDSVLRPQANAGVFRDSESTLLYPDERIYRMLGWTLLRDTSGQPPLIWAPGFPNTDHAVAFAAAVMTLGGVASMDVREENLLQSNNYSGATPREALQAAFLLGKTVSPYLAQTQPLRWAAVHFSEAARDNKRDVEKAWREVLWPTLGAFETFTNLHMPVGVINDQQLSKGQLSDYALLFLPTPKELSEDQKQVVNDFREQGGIVIENKPEWLWGAPGENEKAHQNLQSSLDLYRPLLPFTLEVPPAISVAAYKKTTSSEIILALSNDFSWVQTQITTEPLKQEQINLPALPVNQISLTFRPQTLGIAQPLVSAFDALTGQNLELEFRNNEYHMKLPQLSVMSLIVLEFDK